MLWIDMLPLVVLFVRHPLACLSALLVVYTRVSAVLVPRSLVLYTTPVHRPRCRRYICVSLHVFVLNWHSSTWNWWWFVPTARRGPAISARVRDDSPWLCSHEANKPPSSLKARLLAR